MSDICYLNSWCISYEQKEDSPIEDNIWKAQEKRISIDTSGPLPTMIKR